MVLSEGKLRPWAVMGLIQSCPAGCGEGLSQHLLDSALLNMRIIVQFLKHLLREILEEFSESCFPLVGLKMFLG